MLDCSRSFEMAFAMVYTRIRCTRIHGQVDWVEMACYEVTSSFSSALSLDGDWDRCSMAGLDLAVGGDEAADGGEAGSADSFDSNPARALGHIRPEACMLKWR